MVLVYLCLNGIKNKKQVHKDINKTCTFFFQKTVTYFSDLKPLHSWPNKQQMHEGKQLFLIKNYQVSQADSLLGICVCAQALFWGII